MDRPGTSATVAHGRRAPTISTHVLDTGRGRPAAGLRVTLYKLESRRPADPGQREPDGRRRAGARSDGPAAPAGRLPPPLRRPGRRAGLLQDDGRGLRDHRHVAELSRAAPARAVLDEHVPGELSGGPARAPRPSIASTRAMRASSRRPMAPLFEGAPRFLGRLAAAPSIRLRGGVVRGRARRSPTR